MRGALGLPRWCRASFAGRWLSLSLPFAIWALAWVSVGGCADKSPEALENAKKVAISSEADATADVSDEQYAFKLAWPGEGWKLLRGTDAEQLMPSAAAAMVSDKVVGVVLVSLAPTLDMERYGAQVAERIDLDGRKLLSNDEIQFQGQKARRIAVTGRAGGLALRYDGIVFARGKYAYRLLAWGSAGQVPQDGSGFHAFFQAFTLTESEPLGRSAERGAADTVGVGWRVSGGVFESAVNGLRVTPPEGARLLLGGELRALNPEAEVGLLSRSPDVSMVVVSERAGAEPSAVAERLTRDFAKQLKLVDGFPFDAKWLGAKRSLTHFRRDQRSHLHAVVVDRDRVHQVSIEYARVDSDEAQQLIRKCLAGMKLLSAAEHDKLTTELVASARSYGEVGEHHAVRGGVYRDFKRGIVWTLPKGLWRVRAVNSVKRLNHDAVAYMDNRALGLFALLIMDEPGAMTAASYHKRVVASMEVRVGFDNTEQRATKLAGEGALYSEAAATVRGTHYRYRVVTRTHDGTALQLLVWGRPGDFRANAAQLKALQDGLRIDAGIKAVEHTTEVYRNQRLGFEINLPTAWRFDDLTRPELVPLGRFVRWENEGRWIGVLAVYVPDHGFDQGWFVGYLEQLLRDEYAHIARGSRTEQDGSLAGAPARHVSWSAALQRVDAMLTVRGRVAYAVIAVDNSAAAFEEATRNFGYVE